MSNNEQYIGTAYDNGSSNREFKLKRINEDGFDMAGLTFRLDILYMKTNTLDTAMLEKDVRDRNIVLTWNITDTITSHVGTAKIQIRAFDASGTQKWSSYVNIVYIEEALGQVTPSEGQLTELEQIETKIDAVFASETGRVEAEKGRVTAENNRIENEKGRVTAENNRVSAEEKRVTAENERADAEKAREKAEQQREEAFAQKSSDSEAYAIGTRGGTAVTEGDPAYKNNSKYYAETAGSAASAAASSASAASDSKSAAASSESNAASSKTAAASSASEAEAYGAGTRGGIPVSETDPAYHNNARYYSEQAKDAAPEGMMAKSVYDPTGKEQDVFAFAEDKAKATNIAVNDTYGITDDSPTPAGGLTKKTILQTWLDKVADRIINKLVANDSFQTKLMEFLVNNGTTNLEGFGLDARFGKTLQDQISELNANYTKKSAILKNGENTFSFNWQDYKYLFFTLNNYDNYGNTCFVLKDEFEKMNIGARIILYYPGSTTAYVEIYPNGDNNIIVKGTSLMGDSYLKVTAINKLF